VSVSGSWPWYLPDTHNGYFAEMSGIYSESTYWKKGNLSCNTYNCSDMGAKAISIGRSIFSIPI
jgi:hypothetical protein